MQRKFQSPYLYVLAVVIGTLIFIGGFLVTSQIIYSRNAAVLETNMDNFIQHSIFVIRHSLFRYFATFFTPGKSSKSYCVTYVSAFGWLFP